MAAVRDAAQRGLHVKRASTLFAADERHLALADCEADETHEAGISILAFCSTESPDEVFLAEVVMGSSAAQARQMPEGVHFGASLADIEAKLGAPLLDSGRTDECVRSFPAIETADEQVERTLYYADPDTRQTLELAFLRERLDRIRWSSQIE